jgi:RNA polymerase sigma-70 factor (family 1)
MKSDRELLEELKAGNELAFANLYNRYKQPLYAYTLKMVKDTDCAKDIVHDVFIKVYENQHKIASPDSFKSWIFTITRNQCFTYLKKSKNFSDLEEIQNNAGPDEVSAVIQNKERSDIIKGAMEKLKSEEKEAVILREYLDYSYQEIADIMNTTVSAIKAKLFKARKQLHEILKPSFEGNNI